MHCNICDRQLSEKEISWNADLQAYEPCSTCLDVIMDAAYGQSRPDDIEGEEVLLDTDFDQEDYADLYGNSSRMESNDD